MEQWFATYGTLAALVQADDYAFAQDVAAGVFSRHRRRDVRPGDVDVRQATEADRRAFEAAKDGADIGDLVVTQASDDQMSMFNQQEG